MDTISLYLLLVVLPNLDIMATLFGLVLLIPIIIFCGRVYIDKEDSDKKPLRFLLGLCFFFILISILTPSEEQVYKVVAGSAITNIEDIDKLPSNIVAMANHFLESAVNVPEED